MISKVVFDTEKDTKWNQKTLRQNCLPGYICMFQKLFLLSNLSEKNCISPVLSGFVMDDKVLVTSSVTGIYVHNKYYALIPSHIHTYDYKREITKKNLNKDLIWKRPFSTSEIFSFFRMYFLNNCSVSTYRLWNFLGLIMWSLWSVIFIFLAIPWVILYSLAEKISSTVLKICK